MKRRRLTLGLKQTDVAKRLGVSEFTVIGWERRGRMPEDHHFPAIREFLGHEPWPEPRTLGEHVRAERLRRGLSAKGAAQLIGTNEESVRRWEADAWRPTARTFAKLETFLRKGSPGAQALATLRPTLARSR